MLTQRVFEQVIRRCARTRGRAYVRDRVPGHLHEPWQWGISEVRKALADLFQTTDQTTND